MGEDGEDRALNPLDHDDFVVLCDRLSRSLVKFVRPHETATIDEVLQDLDVDWASMSAVSQAQVIETAKHRLLGLPALLVSGLIVLLTHRIGVLVEASRHRVVDQYNLAIPRTPGHADIQAASTLVSLQGLFMMAEYQRRADGLGQQITSEVADALAAGASRSDITSKVSDSVKRSQKARSDLYWAIMATAALGYARSAVQIGAFDEAGVETYEFVSDLCVNVSDICRYLHGKRFSVAKAVERLRQAEATGDPDSFKMAHPWVSSGTSDDGKDILFYRDRGRKVTVAEIDADGGFGAGMDTAQLEAAGLTIPPLHGNCHSSIVLVAG